jgi:hypothetical protein
MTSSDEYPFSWGPTQHEGRTNLLGYSTIPNCELLNERELHKGKGKRKKYKNKKTKKLN